MKMLARLAVLSFASMGGSSMRSRPGAMEVALESVPAAARAAIEKAAAGGRIGRIEKVSQGGEVKYEAHVTKGAKKSEVVVKEDGSPAK